MASTTDTFYTHHSVMARIPVKTNVMNTAISRTKRHCKFNTKESLRRPCWPWLIRPPASDSSRNPPCWGGPGGSPCRRGTRCRRDSRIPPSWDRRRSAGPWWGRRAPFPTTTSPETTDRERRIRSPCRNRRRDTTADASPGDAGASAFCTLISASSCRRRCTSALVGVDTWKGRNWLDSWRLSTSKASKWI